MVALLREQKALGHDVAAILPAADGSLIEQLDALGIPHHVAPVDIVFARPTLIGKIAALFALVPLLRRLRPDVVQSHIVNSVITTRLASWLADVPVHLGANAHPYSLESDVVRPLEIGTAFCDTATIASCSYTRELLSRHGVPAQQIELIYYAVDQSRHDPALADRARVRAEFGIAPDTPLIGKIAYFYPPANTSALLPPHLQGRGIKGHEVLIRAIPLVLREVPGAKFVLVGRGWGPSGATYEQALHDLADDLGVRDAVLFPGERSDVPDVLAAFDISVHCSLSDNLGGTVESLLMAKPMIVSDIRGFADAVQHEETGLVVPADDPPALAAAIVRLLRDPALAQRLGENGRQRMLAGFTLSKTVADYERLIAMLRPRERGGYRLRVSAARAIALPFRLLPASIGLYRGLRRYGFTLRGFAMRRMRHAISRYMAFCESRVRFSRRID